MYDYLPYSHVESPGFIQFVNEAWPKYKIPYRKHFSDKVIPDLYEEVKKDTMDRLENVAHLSGTSDEWTSLCARFAVVSLTIAYLTDTFAKRTVTICSRSIDGSSNAANVGQSLTQALSDYPGVKDKLQQVCTDEGSVMIATMRNIDIPRRSCALHRLHNVVRDNIPFDPKNGQGANRFVNNMQSRCRKIAGHFSHSHKARNQWKKTQAEVKSESQGSLVLDVKTRWDYTLEMFESFKTHKATVISYCSEYDTPETLSKADWDLIPPCVYLLTPFRNFTKSMSEHGLLSQLIPKIKGLNIFLEKAQQDDNENTKGVRGTLASGLQASLNKRFKDVIDLTDKYATVATFIDPHYKDRHFRSNETELQMVKNEVLSMIPKTDNVCKNVDFDVVEEPPKSVVRDDFDIEGLLEDESQD